MKYWLPIAALFALVVSNIWARAQDPYALEGVRIGMLRQSGDVVWPVDTVSKGEEWFQADRWRDRDRRRRQFMKLSDEELFAQPQLRGLEGEEVTLTFGGISTRSTVRGIVRIEAGCGETEPSWYAPASEFLDLQDVRKTVERAFKRDWKPVLVQINEPNNLTVQTAEHISTIPEELLERLEAEKLPTRYAEVVRLGTHWTVYTDRIQRPARSGAIRTTWDYTGQGFVLEHTRQTNSTIESHMSRNPYGNFEATILFYRRFVGRVYARMEFADRRMFLTKYRGYESDKAVIEELRDGQFERIRVDGFDRGC